MLKPILSFYSIFMVSSYSWSLVPISPVEELKKRMVSTPDYAISVIFDLPVTYNSRVTKWINYFQGPGNKWFRTWLEKSTLHIPRIQADLKKAGLPQDLVYMVMIESGFRNIPIHKPISYEFISVPGGTHLHDVANAIGITTQ
jgi:hypothetical protein